ncbi:hypothetical protein ACHAXS_011279 [Conticribra weissflogii]
MRNNSPSFKTLLLTLAAALPSVSRAFAFPSPALCSTTNSRQRHHENYYHRPNGDRLVGQTHRQPFQPTPPSSSLSSSSSSSLSNNDDGNDAADTLTIAIVSSAKNPPRDTTAFRDALASHPFCHMTGMRLSIVHVLLPQSVNSNDENDVLASSLRSSDIACFPASDAVQSYLRFVDARWNPSEEDVTDEERRSWPNIPPSSDVDDVDPAGMFPEGTGIMAACIDTETARRCLNSGRWMANHIYYPKSGDAVDLKIEEERDDDDDGDVAGQKEWTEDVIESWTASVIQAAGDVMERKFWGGGW